MSSRNWLVVTIMISFLFLGFISTNGYAEIKIGYVNSQKVLASFKDAQDSQKKLDEINVTWENEGREMQKQLQDMSDQLESQSLLLSEERKREKQQEIQNLYLKLQKYQNDKWGQGGEYFRKQEELMGPVIEKINAAIKTVGEADKFDYIFDTVAGNIVYASPSQTDVTDRVMQELEKGTKTTK